MISIVTVSYNAAATIEQTITSVIEQTAFPDIEYIIIDGGSSDNTGQIAQSYDFAISTWVSEPDRGISDAMNKGMKLASGTHVLYLNADDYLIDNTAMERVIPLLDCEIVTAPIVKLREDNTYTLVKPRGFNGWFNLKTGLFHQATLCSKRVLNNMNGFDIRYRLEMDYDLFLRCYRNKIPVKMIDKPFSVMRSGGVSTRTDSATLNARLVEERAIHYRNCPNMLMKSFYNFYWQVYPHYKLTRGRYDRHRAGKPERG